jgi:hypothetical protein
MARELVTLVELAGQTVVAASATDAWGKAKAGFARLLGRGDPARTQAAAARLEVMRGELAGVPAAGLEAARAEQVVWWQARLEDLLKEHPGLAADLRVLVDQVRAGLPGSAVTASEHAVTAGRDVNIEASDGGVAAGVIHGNVAAPGPTRPGPVN